MRNARIFRVRAEKNRLFLRLAGEIAHEVNNPLAILMGFSSRPDGMQCEDNPDLRAPEPIHIQESFS